ncbi:LysR family transcriptional regulator [Microbulbifer sp. 2304DJ12-6]|uniref:LysR family transcriptional regulator n=1 Tax=Microbulbifer spongiae TaxID=2944933 RepID=A0ABY9ECJ4_9GAMM|nr:LysR family transcriptional regulator [Microbulbifer sp. MI-G]WKD50170.1 LysR family transcriptional regulator [Microbulbifer sp. MI-G]
MEIYQIKTFVAVAREGSITRAAECLYLSQPAVSAHIKAIEEQLGLVLFERNTKGMRLTDDGKRLLNKAEKILAAHRDFIDESSRMKDALTGKLVVGAGSESSTPAIGHLLSSLSERCPGVDVRLQYFEQSVEMLKSLRNGTLDACFYNEPNDPAPDIHTLEVSRFGIFLAAPAGLVVNSQPLNWQSLSAMPWISPNPATCCGRAAENLFKLHNFRPKQIIKVDRENVIRTLIAGGVGIGLLHTDTARETLNNGKIDLICEVHKSVRVLFAYLPTREQDPLLEIASSILRSKAPG